MRLLRIFLLLSVTLCCFLDTIQAQEFPRVAICHYKIPGCTRHYRPICGTDGRTYANHCVLCQENDKREVQVLIQKHGEC
ncbi:serine protease inhibitor Kazal-type 1-like [Monodelphis domestica]|uniref:serine protease inhibitor Kazal-type 1-like n=1 Tax=Monodelphis domestica TaxID=13616 RepID=UPI0004431A22|nr:serine protease inhibitor Kazal-type 1-like [Monodelphis domestica]XP_007474158.1 serine protease inhibitor Kazal-type 1-like [Monodelphis domestica]